MSIASTSRPPAPRDHGGGVDGARAVHGGRRTDWIDMSTGINPEPYPVPLITARAWADLPDTEAQMALTEAAAAFWSVPEGTAVLAAPGASALIARIPHLRPAGRVVIPGPTYNEHAAAFAAAGWTVEQEGPGSAKVVVHPNNPDGRLWAERELDADFVVIDESFCDVCPERSHVRLAARPGVIVLKSFGKFWGLAGLRLGFAIAQPGTLAELAEALGPWPVSGPALEIGTMALRDLAWAEATRIRLRADSTRMDRLLTDAGATVVGGTLLFRLYDVGDAAGWQDRLAAQRLWTRRFPYSERWLRLGLPPAQGWDRLKAVL